MASQAEVVECPLTRDALGARYREICADARFTDLPGKIELDNWGRMLMSPATNRRGLLQSRLAKRLDLPHGESLVEASVVTEAGVLVADVAWASDELMLAHGSETPFSAAPEVCVEIASPSNSIRELREKVAAYLNAGAHEAWIVFPQSRRIERHDGSGPIERSRYAIDEGGLFD